MFDVTFLGTSSATPTVDRSLPSVAIRKDGDVILFDCGEGTQRQMMKYGVSYMKVKAIFISHLHMDHFLGVFGLVETMALNGRKGKLTLYGPRGSNAVFGKKNFVEIIEVDGKFSADFETFAVSAFEAKHGKDAFGFCIQEKSRRRFHEEKAKALGLKGRMFTEIQNKGSLQIGGKTIKLSDITYLQPGKKIVYSGDSAPCASLAKAAKGADILIHEATFCEDKKEEAKEAQHSTALQAAKAAKKAGVKALILTHFSGRYRDSSPILAEAKQEFENSQVAHDGLRAQA
jgi:ribonuclease Z